MALTKVSGDVLDAGLNVAGVVTATRFEGPMAGGTGDFSGNVSIGGTLHVAGVSTIVSNLIVEGDVYTDKIRRQSDSGTTTKILLDDEVLKFYGGHASNELIKAQAGLTTITGDVYASGGMQVGAALTVKGDLTVEGTRTEVKTASLEITDKTVGIASLASPSDATADGAGIVVYGATDKSLKWVNSNDRWTFVGGDVSATAYHGDGSNLTGIDQLSGIGITNDYPNYRPTLDFNFAAVKKLDSRITYQRLGPASYIDEFGIIKVVGDNTPRFDHDPITRESKGLLIEEQRTNHQTYSEEISRANNSNVTITNNNAISPDGTQNASRIVGSGSDSSTNINWGSQAVASGHFTTWSIFVKSTETSCILQFWTNTYVGGNNRVNVELADGTTGGNAVSGNTWFWKVEEYPNSWWRVSWGGTGNGSGGGMHINVVPSKSSARNATSGSAVNKTYYAWGVQEEHGSGQNFATSYIRTNSKATIRGADQVTISGSDFTDFYNDIEGTFSVSHSILSAVPDGKNCYVFEVSDGGATHVAFRYNDVNSSFANKPAFHSVYNSGLSASMNASGTYTRGQIVKGAMTAKASSFKATWNGETIQTDGSGSLFGPGTTGQLAIGRYHPTPGYELNGHIQRMSYWPKQLSSNQLVNLTS